MSAGLLLGNLVSYSAQVLALTIVGGVLPSLLRVHHPRTQLLYFRLLLAVCLLLPALQPWRRPVLLVVAPTVAAASATNAPATAPLPVPVHTTIRWEEVALAAIGAGAALRFFWLLFGLWRLRRYRAGATPLDPLPPSIEAAQLRTGADATVMLSNEAGGPVTFGAWHPVILLPPGLLEQPAEAQFGVACHEFLHVRRRDWLYTVLEEFAAALVWFHPAIWWLVGRIRLVREQVVDGEVVALTEAREPYVQTLLAMGGAPPQPDLAPASLFFRRRQLSNRIHSLLKEVTMSKGRLVSCYVLSSVALAVAAWFAAASFPLQASPRVQVQPSVSPVPLIAARIAAAPVPHEARPMVPAEQGVSPAPQDYVAVVVSGFAEPILSNMRDRLKEFQGRPYTMELRAEIARAAREIDPSARVPMMNQIETPEGSLVTTFMVTAAQGGPRLAARSMWQVQSGVQFDLSNLAEPLQGRMRARLAQYEGRQYTPELNGEINGAIKEIDPSGGIGSMWQTTTDGRSTSRLFVMTGVDPGKAAASSSSASRIFVSSAEQAAKLVVQPKPQYPFLARQARIQGTVRFSAVVNKDGRVASLTLVSGHPLLITAAEEAVKQWVYQPTLLNGQPVEVVTQIDVAFVMP